ncbi:MAG: hypothetical protein Q7J68_06410 [Thermoplasmata archaeon]|nr:hypothetical protein [Thermoplasmata archaeon]
MDNDVRMKLNALGSEGALDTLICLKKHDWATASEVAKDMETHVATAVKRLNLLHEAGFLDRRVRKGKTRSAQEYSLFSTRMVIELNLEGGADTGNAEFMGALLRDILERLGRFGGRTVENVLRDWKKIPGIDSKIITWLENNSLDKTYAQTEKMLKTITIILTVETREYGELTIKALARASLDAVTATHGQIIHDLPTKYFGGE